MRSYFDFHVHAGTTKTLRGTFSLPFSRHLTEHFTNLEPDTEETYVVQKRRSADFKALEL